MIDQSHLQIVSSSTHRAFCSLWSQLIVGIAPSTEIVPGVLFGQSVGLIIAPDVIGMVHAHKLTHTKPTPSEVGEHLSLIEAAVLVKL